MKDEDRIEFIQKNEAWVTHSIDEAGTLREWRCYVSPRHFTTPDIRERTEKTGFGTTAREAIDACINS